MQQVLWMLAGVILMAAVVAVYQLFKVLRQIALAVTAIKPEQIGQTMVAVQVLSSQFGSILSLLRDNTEAMRAFSQLMFARPENDRGVLGTGPLGGSGIYPYDEQAAAKLEEQSLLRATGWETDPRRSNQPSIAAMEVPPPPSVAEAETVPNTPA